MDSFELMKYCDTCS